MDLIKNEAGEEVNKSTDFERIFGAKEKVVVEQQTDESYNFMAKATV